MKIDWHDSLIQHLCERYRVGKLPHALLLHGAAGIGKSLAAKKLAQAILCLHNSNGEPCGQCQSCQLILADTHPNFTFITPEENAEKQTKLPIKIDTIRDLSARLVMTSQLSGPNIAIIQDAESMNHFAANALLKTLEEPTANTLIILITNQLTRLLPTIRSRCQQYNLQTPKQEQSLDWIKSQLADKADTVTANENDMLFLMALTNNAPLKVLHLLKQDFVSKRKTFLASLKSFIAKKVTIKEMANVASELEIQNLIAVLQSILLDGRKLQAKVATNGLVNKDADALLRLFNESYSSAENDNLFDQVIEFKRIQNPSINMQLMLESFFAAWHNK